MHRLLIAALIALFPPAAQACITIHPGDEEFTLTGPELAEGRQFEVIAGGPQSLRNCSFLLSGHVQPDPNFSFHLSEMEGYSLELRAEGECDTVLLMRRPNAHFLSDDDSGGDLNPMITAPPEPVLNGRVDVWVGTYGPDSCPAVLTLRSLRP